jgi:KaiC/GvpD/RAD55 family RecA-like ATPase
MNKENIVLKYILENNQWITLTHDLCFTEKRRLVKQLANDTIKQGRSVSLHQIGLLLKELDQPETLDLLKAIHSSPMPDKAVFEELRLQLRLEAKTRTLKEIAEQELTPKQYADVLKDLNDLELDDRPEELNPPVSFKDWSQHIAPDLVYLHSGIDPFLNTGTDTKIGDVFNILAASGNFKTGLMTHITKSQLLAGRNVLFYSMEETAQSFNARVGQGLLGLTEYQYAQLTEEEIAQRFTTFNLGELDVISGKVIHIETMAEEIKELEAERGYKYDFIIPDYSSMIEVKNASKQAREDQLISKIFRELKMIATNQNKVVVTAIQANRDGYGKSKSPRVENTGGSMGGVHVADMMVSLKYKTNPDAIIRPTLADVQPEDIKGFVKLTVRKKRTGTIAVDDAFLFQHKANGNMVFTDRMSEDMVNLELWDNLFETE